MCKFKVTGTWGSYRKGYIDNTFLICFKSWKYVPFWTVEVSDALITCLLELFGRTWCHEFKTFLLALEWLVIKSFNLKFKPAIGENNSLNQLWNRMVTGKTSSVRRLKNDCFDSPYLLRFRRCVCLWGLRVVFWLDKLEQMGKNWNEDGKFYWIMDLYKLGNLEGPEAVAIPLD